jgi:hypothetical protein
MTVNETLHPADAPFSTTTIHRGLNRLLTPAEVTAANLAFPKPPYGNLYWPPSGAAPRG